MIKITASLSLNESELHYDFVQASGPGGQNVNKVATAVQLRFDVAHSPSLPEPVRARLMRLAGSRITKEGELIINASRYRTQEANKEDAFNRLVALIREAAQPLRRRRATRPSHAAVERRLEKKRRQAQKKRERRSTDYKE
ncbi:MAG TPA: aminoacyl-tRNA hydrolase [Anaerolineaceae bacterium]|uniref:Class I peptide chain release factor n=1 Tax=Anaerolinea thermophila TaxID=167964 RepID=A0A117LH46_9CHLR|nr:MAG: Class I peptide chain release factor [Anaerolinea thermophila]HAF60897.1 aminoacyl-tRNA hydrolase [Anaerolineaceae bacterium]